MANGQKAPGRMYSKGAGLVVAAGLILALSYTTAAAVEAAAPEVVLAEGITPADWAELVEGKPVVKNEMVRDAQGQSHGLVRGFILADVSWPHAFETLVQHEKDPEWYRSCMKGVEIISRSKEGENENVKAREIHESLWITMGFTLDYVHDPEKREIRWTLDKAAKNDMFAEYRGAWRFIPLGEKNTLITYSLSGEASGWTPQFLQDYFTVSSMPEFLKMTKKRVEDAGINALNKNEDLKTPDKL